MKTIDQISPSKVAVKPAAIEQAVEQAAAMLKAAGAEEVYLFGSTAEGQLHPHSDIDLAVVGLPPEHFFQVMGEILLALSRPLDLVDLDIDTAFTRYLRQKDKLHRVA